MKALGTKNRDPEGRRTQHQRVIAAVSHRDTPLRTESKNMLMLFSPGGDLPIFSAQTRRELTSCPEGVGREQVHREVTSQLLKGPERGHDRLTTIGKRAVDIENQMLKHQVICPGNRDADAHRPPPSGHNTPPPSRAG